MPHIEEPLLQAYIDGFCGDARVSEIEAHLDGCEECRGRIDNARRAAERASELLGSLEPGPVHEPSFEELKERALGTPATPDEVAAALQRARAATTPTTPRRAPLWRRPLLAWAATIVVAFTLGWLTRGGVDISGGQRVRGDAVTGSDLDRSPQPPASAQAAPSKPAGGEEREQAVGAEADDSRTAATEPPAPVPDAVPQNATASRAAGVPATPPGSEASRGAAAKAVRPAAEENVAARSEPIAVTGESPVVDVAGRQGVADAVAASSTADAFVTVDRDVAELWLGAPPRFLPGLALLRVEVGPGTRLDPGIAGRVAVRSVYRAAEGQEITLMQQYTGGVDALRRATVGAAVDRGGGERAERAAAGDAAADYALAFADRDRAVLEELDLPATTRDPDGRVTYSWRDAEGYLLSISAPLEADVVRGLADTVR